jgi:ketosteroid isomerase-like protein
MDWIPFARERQSRFESQHGELDERSLVRKGNAAYAAGLGLLMAHDAEASDWLGRAAAAWRESWQGGESWGRPIGAIKA